MTSKNNICERYELEKLTCTNQRVNYLTYEYRDYEEEFINGKKIHKLEFDLILSKTNKTEIRNLDEMLSQTSEDERILLSIPEKILNISIPAVHKKNNEIEFPQTTENERKEIFESLDINPIFQYKDQLEFEFMNLLI